ncbi:MAG TPA: hypothetical protein VGR28_11720 [Candidatus Thermoplasmatota archaeon]|jgi:hypothetical protein|nr:hypothetical protein [Candidatus Thermoplasmatota archaeon]
MPFLDNPSESPCWGCGPQHARGLHLQFERVGDEVLVRYTPKADEVGWPGLFHTGLHYAVAYECAYWACLELGGAVGIPKGPQNWDQQRLPPTGAPFLARARIAAATPDGLKIQVRSESLEGRLYATLDVGFRWSSRAKVEASGVQLPAYLLDEMKP